VSGERDGVSLEIEKRRKMLEKLGHEVHYLSGYDPRKDPHVHVIPEMDLKAKVIELSRDLFFYKKGNGEDIQEMLFNKQKALIYRKARKIIGKLKPDFIFVHNVFSHAYNLPATVAILETLDEREIPTICVHHDFWFERKNFLNPKSKFIENIISFIPPKRNYINSHQVINSIAKKELFSRRGIRAELIGDYFDFSQKRPTLDNFNGSMKKKLGIEDTDIIVLQATRITWRKAIENSIRFCHELQSRLDSNDPKILEIEKFKGKKNVKLLLQNFVETDDADYKKDLEKLAKKLKVKTIFGAKSFSMQRQFKPVKKYSFWDAYLLADIVTYPSILEGFGNQFLEAIYFRLLPVVFEYPVFKKDLKKLGYKYISLGDKIVTKANFHYVPQKSIKRAVDDLLDIYQKPKLLDSHLDKNFKIAKKYHDISILEKDLRKLLSVI
jgi:hypothetical protein